MIAANIVEFSRVLRRAGLAVASDRVLVAIAAIECVGVARRDDVHAVLASVMLDRHEQQPIFDSAFDAFWRDPKLVEQLMQMLLPTIVVREKKHEQARNNRLAAALAAPAPPPPKKPLPEQKTVLDTRLTFTPREQLQRADFETMTPAEFTLAKTLAEQLPPPFAPVRRRRHQATAHGKLDLKAPLKRMLRQPHTLLSAQTQPLYQLPPVVVLLDISGSMDRYARILLHYVHGLTRHYVRVETFTFGTRLTNITRCLKHRDPDVALQQADEWVLDWKGGTRIAACLDEFNRRWARRVLGSNAAVLLVTDGLDGDEHGNLGAVAAQLRRLAHRIGSTPCCVSKASSPRRQACARCYRTWIAYCRCTTLPAWQTSAGPYARQRSTLTQ